MICSSCKYAPIELMAGFDEKVERLDPAPAAFTCAEGCTHPNMCSYAKAVIEEVYDKNIKELILTDCCDAMRRAYDALLMEGKIDFLYLLPIPHKSSPVEIRMFAKSLKELAETFEKYSGRQFEVNKSVEAYRMQMSESHEVEGNHITVTGAHGGKQLIDYVQSVFPDVQIKDDTCSGNRHLYKEPGDADDFFNWYADALMNQEKSCMRMLDATENIDSDDGRIGTIFHTIKFCDYYGFEYMMTENRDRTLKVETDTLGQSTGQLSTRLEAFREELGMEKKTNEILNGRYVAGIDSGSTSTDVVIMDSSTNIITSVIISTAAGSENSSKKALDEALEKAHLDRNDIERIVTTGYGRGNIKASDEAVTEITCHAKGAHFLYPEAHTVIDIGGQDSKVIIIDSDGKVENFVMNDKCAAGTGRFLENSAKVFGYDMAQMSAEGLKWKKDLTITSMCTVFAESEVVSLIADNTPTADIIHGLNKSIAKRTASLVMRLKGSGPYIMTGGVARNAGVVKCLEEELHDRIYVSEDAQICGAIGACLSAFS